MPAVVESGDFANNHCGTQVATKQRTDWVLPSLRRWPTQQLLGVERTLRRKRPLRYPLSYPSLISKLGIIAPAFRKEIQKEQKTKSAELLDRLHPGTEPVTNPAPGKSPTGRCNQQISPETSVQIPQQAQLLNLCSRMINLFKQIP